MKKVLCVVTVLSLLVPSVAQAQPTLGLGLSIRENGNLGGVAVGDPGPAILTAPGGLEFVDRDIQQLTLDNTWQKFTFDMANATLTNFVLGNGVWDYPQGIIDAIVIDSGGNDGPITLWIDDLEEIVDPTGPPPPTSIVLTDWENWLDGDEVAFQEPTYSGSTAALLVAGGTAGVDNSVANGGTGSYRIDYQWIDNSPANWLRLTQYNVTNDGNTTVDLQAGSIVSFWMKGVPEPSTLALLGLSSLALLRRRR